MLQPTNSCVLCYKKNVTLYILVYISGHWKWKIMRKLANNHYFIPFTTLACFRWFFTVLLGVQRRSLRNSNASASNNVKRLLFHNIFNFFTILLLFLLFLFYTRWNAQTPDVSSSVDLILLVQGVTDFSTKILGKLEVKFHVYVCAVP